MRVVPPFRDLRGERIELVALDEAGLLDMHEYSTDPAFYRYMEYEPHRSLEETRAYLDLLKARSASGSAHYWFIRLRGGRKVIGTFGVHHIDPRRRSVEIGYGIGRPYWGQGYFKEALHVVLHYLFEHARVHRVGATTPRANEASLRALQGAGFSIEGVMRDYYRGRDGVPYDAVVLSLLQPEYVRRHGDEGSRRRFRGTDDRMEGPK